MQGPYKVTYTSLKCHIAERVATSQPKKGAFFQNSKSGFKSDLCTSFSSNRLKNVFLKENLPPGFVLQMPFYFFAGFFEFWPNSLPMILNDFPSSTLWQVEARSLWILAFIFLVRSLLKLADSCKPFALGFFFRFFSTCFFCWTFSCFFFFATLSGTLDFTFNFPWAIGD